MRQQGELTSSEAIRVEMKDRGDGDEGKTDRDFDSRRASAGYQSPR